MKQQRATKENDCQDHDSNDVLARAACLVVIRHVMTYVVSRTTVFLQGANHASAPTISNGWPGLQQSGIRGRRVCSLKSSSVAATDYYTELTSIAVSAFYDGIFRWDQLADVKGLSWWSDGISTRVL